MSVSGLFQNGGRPNILIIITDQERALQHWPESFSKEHLPAMERLKRNGLTFRHHYTNACMCSPSRSTLLTSQFPVKTGVVRTGSPGPPRHMPTNIPNLATVMKEAGYSRVEWHGKWHVGKTPSEYGFEGWQPPDAGNYLAVNDTLGGGTPDNDGRFLKDLCHSLERYADACKVNNGSNNRSDVTTIDDDNNLQQQPEPSKPNDIKPTTSNPTSSASMKEPFCVVASFVNPHDVYVAQHGPAKGYTHEDLHTITVPLPSNCDEDTDENDKPRAHSRMSSRCVPFECTQQEYVNFYAYLHTLVDAQIGKLLDKVDELGFTENTLVIRTADHGEQGLSHSLVEKFFNCYQESLNIPLVISNPIAFPEPRTTNALSSHLDLLPTLAGLLGHTTNGTENATGRPTTMQGRDLTTVFDDPAVTTTIMTETTATLPQSGGKSQTTQSGRTETQTQEATTNAATRQLTFPGIQKSIHFTYDDIAFPGAPSIVRCLHKGTLKYAVYFTPNGRDADWEMYDLRTDPLEDNNLAGKPQFRELQMQLEQELYETMVQHETLPTAFRWPPSPTPYSVGYDHPPEIRERLLREREENRHRDRSRRSPPSRREDPITSYVFRDEGERVSIILGMKNVRSLCSDRDISVLNIPHESPGVDDDSDDDSDENEPSSSEPTILVLIVRNFLPDDIQLSFGKPKAEIIDTDFTIRENELAITMTKKDPNIEWKSFHS